MRRFLIVLITMVVAVAGASAPRVVSVSASNHRDAVAAKKKQLSLTQHVDAYLRHVRFSGSVLLASKGSVLVRKSYGMADREHGLANTPQTRFLLGHITKQFTAMSILLLQERGKLTVQNRICAYLSTCPAAWKQITIHQLLDQSSGISDMGDVPGATAATTPDNLISLFKHMALQFAPGTGFYFSDPGYVILGVIVAKVSGEPYATFVQKNIFAALQMANSGFRVNNVAVPHRAFGYLGSTKATDLKLAYPNAAYGMYSTTSDLSRWDEALGHGLLLTKSWVATFTAYERIPSAFSFPSSFSPVGMGYGWFITRDAGHRLVFYEDSPGNNGAFGFELYNGRYLDDKVTVILLGNRSMDAHENIIGAALAAMVFARH